ncbi:MAG: hypothetical protein AB2A00_33885 [Myxococcota bacterium]
MSVTTLARNLSADGRLSSWDAMKVVQEAKTSGTAGAEEVKKLLADPGFAALITPGARRQLSNFVSAAAPTGNALGALPDGTKLFLKQGVFVPAPDAALPATPKAYGETVYQAARMFAEPGMDVAAKLSLADKSAVVERTLVGLRQCKAGPNTPAGYDGPSQAAQQRSASATVLREIMASLKGAEPQGRLLQDKVLRELVDMIHAETNPGLRDHMAFHLNALKDTLPTPEQRALVEKAFQKFAPTTPPYDQWFKDGNNQLNVVCHTGGEFFQSEVDTWKREGFKVVQEGDYSKPTILEKELRGDNGQVTKVQLKMFNGDHGTFDDMDDPKTHVVAYSGHSGWGKNMPRQLRNAPEMAGDKKVLLIHQCCGQGITNKIRDKYPEADLVTTRYSSYEHEDHMAFKSFLDGVANRRSWDDIHTRIENGHYRNNYVTPADEFTRMKTHDRDHDGRADVLDKVFDFDTFDVPGDTATAFVPNEASRRDKVLAGTRVHNASQIVNTTLGFSHYLEHMEKGNPFLSGGFFTAAPGSADEKKMVRVVEKNVDLKAMGVDAQRAGIPSGAQKVYEIQLNSRYAHASEEVVKAAAFVEVGMKYANGSSKGERMLQSLMLVAHSLNVDEEFGREEMIFDNLKKFYNLPDSITFSDARRYLSSDSHVYAGSQQGLREWKTKLGAAGMEQLEKALKDGGQV